MRLNPVSCLHSVCLHSKYVPSDKLLQNQGFQRFFYFPECRWLNQQLTEAQLGKLPGSVASSRYNTFTRSNTSGLCYSSCLTNNRPGEATTPLSSNSSLGGNSGSTAFKSQFPMSSPYLSSTATPFSGVPTIQVKPQQSGLGVFHSTPSMTGSQRSMYVPITKNALQATQKVQYKPKTGLTTPSVVTGVSNLCSYTEGTIPMESSLLNSWDDSGSWGSKHNILPRPQLSFADRSACYSLLFSVLFVTTVCYFEHLHSLKVLSLRLYVRLFPDN